MARELLSSDASDSEDGGADLGSNIDLKVNEKYAQRFEYNKKREERARRTQ
jgi:protein KRI1